VRGINQHPTDSPRPAHHDSAHGYKSLSCSHPCVPIILVQCECRNRLAANALQTSVAACGVWLSCECPPCAMRYACCVEWPYRQRGVAIAALSEGLSIFGTKGRCIAMTKICLLMDIFAPTQKACIPRHSPPEGPHCATVLRGEDVHARGWPAMWQHGDAILEALAISISWRSKSTSLTRSDTHSLMRMPVPYSRRNISSTVPFTCSSMALTSRTNAVMLQPDLVPDLI
jgi:hypothetical protein